MRKFILIFALSVIAAVSLNAQDSFFSRWQQRVTKTQSQQPSWSVPLVAPYPMLIQVFRADFSRQITPTLTPTWNYGASRGLNLIPGFNSEFDVYYPPYFQHNSPKAKDGFGDTVFLYKYRIYSSNEGNGTMLSAQLTGSIPTGSYSNGSPDASVSPTLLGGKGIGRFDVISSLGGALPTGEVKRVGRSIAWNTTAQYHLGKYLWPELESNATWYYAGKNDGKMQNFVTPGLTVSRIKLNPSDRASRLGAAFGAGMQIATSGFHTYNHNLVFTGRLVF